MSDHFWFYVETRADGEWRLPNAFVAPEAPVHRRVRYFDWLRGSSATQAVFFGAGALFPFRRERPPAWQSSALFHWLYPDGNAEREPPVVSWLPYAELMVDLWEETPLIVLGRVPAAAAALFGDGVGPFPEPVLLAAGWSEDEVRRFRAGTPAGAAVDRSFGPGRAEIAARHPAHPLAVTWRATVAEYLGRERTESYRSLRRFGPDADLRVISVFH